MKAVKKNKRKSGLIAEYRNMGDCDAWGSSMQAWFAVAHELFARGADIPSHWEFKPGICLTPETAREDDNYWFEVFGEYSDEDLVTFGNILERYARLLKHLEQNY